ncbi:MAG: PP2C family protein-serine/threonine phosphatase [Bacteroidota bacterium]|nr:PP2C family protein-serine/threonine phosphatase [Bacteroidota bacterium]MDP3144755.1 PP2C family protein-serine/threonine phosphatase [Bacteroidota bacterium]MDP3557874.1 PP2C family protein-serine/threonine phosphatase [Bacteroidota bacterium]
MSDSSKISQQKQVQDLKLNALLEVTKAINNNYSTSELFELYQDILENRLGVGKLVLFVFEGEWKCLLKYGIKKEIGAIQFEKELLAITEIETINYSKGEITKQFEIVVPVFHKKTPLAYVLLSDVNQQKIELSAAIKHLPFVQTLTNIIIVAIENKKLFKDNIQRAQIRKELELAQSMQQMLFPKDLPNSDGLLVAAKYLPHQQVGGDYYDFIKLNNHEFVFCVADVSGKGVAAAILMSNIQATLQSLVTFTHNLKDIIIEINKRVITNAKNEKFVSFFLAKLNTKSQQLTYINAGHNPPILFYENKFLELSSGCPLLGITENLPVINVEIFNYTSEFTLLCYTDGLTDTINEEKENISIETIKDIIQVNEKSNPDFLNQAILFYAEDFKGEVEFPDDIALLTLKVSDLNF